MDIYKAKKNAQNELDALAHMVGIPLAIAEDQTIEKKRAWFFFYNSKRYLEDGILNECLAGNGPIVVEKETGTTISYGTTPYIDELLLRYE